MQRTILFLVLILSFLLFGTGAIAGYVAYSYHYQTYTNLYPSYYTYQVPHYYYYSPVYTKTYYTVYQPYYVVGMHRPYVAYWG